MVYLFESLAVSPKSQRGTMGSQHPTPRYGAYLLRIWEVRNKDTQGAPIWRFSLEPVHSRERLGFPDLESLMAFLRSLTITSPTSGEKAFQASGLREEASGICK